MKSQGKVWFNMKIIIYTFCYLDLWIFTCHFCDTGVSRPEVPSHLGPGTEVPSGVPRG